MSDSVSREAVLVRWHHMAHTEGVHPAIERRVSASFHALPAVEPDPVTEAAVALADEAIMPGHNGSDWLELCAAYRAAKEAADAAVHRERRDK